MTKRTITAGRITAVRVVSLLFTIAVCVAAFGFSSADSEKTSGVSSSIAEDYVHGTVREFESLTPAWQRAHLRKTEGVIRKFAHAAEYLAMGCGTAVFFCTFIVETDAREEKKKRRPTLSILLLFAFLFCLLFAATDEWHQTFVPGRDGNIADVLLDAVSAAIGILIIGGAARVWENGR